MNTSQDHIDNLMESFHEFVLEYKCNPKNKDFIYNALKGEDDFLIYTLMLFQKVNDINKCLCLCLCLCAKLTSCHSLGLCGRSN